MTSDEYQELKAQIDRMIPIIEALGELLVPASEVTRVKELDPNTIGRNDNIRKFNEVGKRKLLLPVRDVAVIKNRKRKK